MRRRENIVFLCEVKKEECVFFLCSIVYWGFKRKLIVFYLRFRLVLKLVIFVILKIIDECGCLRFGVFDFRYR